MEVCDIDVKIEEENLAMILLVFLPPSNENFMSSLSVGKDSITLEEVTTSHYSREL